MSSMTFSRAQQREEAEPWNRRSPPMPIPNGEHHPTDVAGIRKNVAQLKRTCRQATFTCPSVAPASCTNSILGAFTLEKLREKCGKSVLKSAIKSATFRSVLTFTSAVGAPGHQLQNWGKTENWQFRNYRASCDMRMSHLHVLISNYQPPHFPLNGTDTPLPCSLAAPLLTQTGSSSLTPMPKECKNMSPAPPTITPSTTADST